jgi:lysophospholipase L1-like esterase
MAASALKCLRSRVRVEYTGRFDRFVCQNMPVSARILLKYFLLSASLLSFSRSPAIAQSVSLVNPFESEIEALQARLIDPPARPIVFYGSSSIRLWNTLPQDLPDYAVLNCGFGGSRLADCLYFAPRVVLPLKPSAVVIYAGDNDLATGAGPEQVFDSFRQLFFLLRASSPELPIAFVSVKPCPARFKYVHNIERFNQLVDDFLGTQSDTDYIDIFSDLLGPDHQPVVSLFRSDQIHLSQAGYQILRRDISEYLHDEFPKRLSVK